MSDFLNGTGFLGTHAPLRADLALALTLVSVVLLTLGVWLAKRKRFAAHKWVQIAAVILNALVVLVSMIAMFFSAILPGIGALNGFILLALLHSLTGLLGMALGISILLRTSKLLPKKLRLKKFKLVMRVSYVLYVLAAGLGVWFYILLYS
jgi:uncharacterized membrane protein YozB (DUF420 family)